MLNTLLALLAVAVVMAVHGIAKLVLLPFRVLGGPISAQGPAGAADGPLTRFGIMLEGRVAYRPARWEIGRSPAP